MPPGEIAPDWPFVGRNDEVRRIVALVHRQGRHGAVIAGPPGVGKTRVARECLVEAERSGLPTARVAATRASAHLPFGTLAPLLPAEGPDRPPEQPADFLNRCRITLAERAGGRRLVLMVDDAHLLDDSSATLVHLLAQTNAAFVLATVRTGEHAPDPVVALWKESLAERVDLAGLTDDVIEELVSTVLQGPVEHGTLTRLAARCEGNVLFLRELVVGALQNQTLVRHDGLWRLAGPLILSDRLVEIVETRLAGLGDSHRRLLELIALGEPVGIAEVTSLADPGDADVLERQGLLQSRLDGRRLEIRLGHPLYGEVIRSRMPVIRTRTLHRNLADTAEATGARRREDPLRIATWRLQGGGTARPDLMVAAAQQARARWALPLAERLATAAIEAGAGFPARLLLGQLYWLQGRAQEAEALLADLASTLTDDAERAAVASSRMDNLVMGLGRLDIALAVAGEAEAAIADDRYGDAVAAQRARLVYLFGDMRGAIEALEPIISRADGATLVDACITAASALGLNGRADAALHLTERGLAAHRALAASPLPLGAYIHLLTRSMVLCYTGHLAEAERLGRTEHGNALVAESIEAQGLFAAFLARTLIHRGLVATAARFAREAVTLLRERGSPFFLRVALMPLAHAEALAGRPDEAQATLAELDGIRLPAGMLFGPELLEIRAWTEVAAGSVVAGHRLLEEAAAMAEHTGELVLRAAALHDLARLGWAKDVAGALEDLTAAVEGPLMPARAQHAAALASGDGPALERVSAAFEAIGADLIAAEASADAAVVWRRQRDGRKANAAERRSGMLAGRCEGATTPALHAVETRVVLTPAERQVAALAAAGRSNKEIAAELYLSLRTVENYLHRAYEKLGVSGRAELAGALEA
jgi:DNA-binding CsgD family transcriptional regulator